MFVEPGHPIGDSMEGHESPTTREEEGVKVAFQVYVTHMPASFQHSQNWAFQMWEMSGLTLCRSDQSSSLYYQENPENNVNTSVLCRY